MTRSASRLRWFGLLALLALVRFFAWPNVWHEPTPTHAQSPTEVVRAPSQTYVYYFPIVALSPTPRPCLPTYPLRPPEFDPRLSVQITPAVVTSGQLYWRVIRVNLESLVYTGGLPGTAVRISVLDDSCRRAEGVLLAANNPYYHYVDYYNELPLGDPCQCEFKFNYSSHGGYDGFRITEGNPALPDDIFVGAGSSSFGFGYEKTYRVVFQRVLAP